MKSYCTVTRRGLLICALLSLAMVAGSGRATAAPPVPVSLIEADNFVGGTATDILLEGVFTGTIGTVAVSGTTHMETIVVGNTFHCTHEWAASDGSLLVLASNCNMGTMNGQWHVVYGDGIFANLFEGSLMMDLDGYNLGGTDYDVAEILTGRAH
jgi:hypothetical protein